MVKVAEFEFPTELYYDRVEHLWLRREPDGVRVGIDVLAQQALGEIVHIAIAEPGTAVSRGDQVGSVEAEKMVTTVVSPVHGRLVARNESVMRTPMLAGSDPYGAGWLALIETDDLAHAATDLVHGTDQLTEWAEAEVRRYRDEGWVE